MKYFYKVLSFLSFTNWKNRTGTEKIAHIVVALFFAFSFSIIILILTYKPLNEVYTCPEGQILVSTAHRRSDDDYKLFCVNVASVPVKKN